MRPSNWLRLITGDDGRFTLSVEGPADQDSILYIVAKGGEPTAHKGSGDNPAIALIAVIGSKPPAHVVINEFTTVASVWTNAQFLEGTDSHHPSRARTASRNERPVYTQTEGERRWLTNIFARNATRWWRRVTSIADATRTTTSNFAPSADPGRKRRQIGLMRTPVAGTEF